MAQRLTDFAPLPYTVRALDHVLLTTGYRWRTLKSLRHALVSEDYYTGAEHMVAALGMQRGELERDGEAYRRYQGDGYGPGVDTPVREPRGWTRMTPDRSPSGWTPWHLWADGSWWRLTPGTDHRGNAEAARVASRMWAHRHLGGTAHSQVVIPDRDPDAPWFVRFVPASAR